MRYTSPRLLLNFLPDISFIKIGHITLAMHIECWTTTKYFEDLDYAKYFSYFYLGLQKCSLPTNVYGMRVKKNIIHNFEEHYMSLNKNTEKTSKMNVVIVYREGIEFILIFWRIHLGCNVQPSPNLLWYDSP